MDRALDLPLAEERIYGATDIVGGDDVGDIARLGVELDQLGGVAERRVDDRVLDDLRALGAELSVGAEIVVVGPWEDATL